MMYRLGVISFLVFFFSSSAFSSPECLSSGQLKDDFILQTAVVNRKLVKKERTGWGGRVIQPEQAVSNPGIYGQSIVDFNGQNIQLLAFANNTSYTTIFRKIESYSRGKLYTDFVVDCGSSTNESIAATITFQTKVLGRLITFYPGGNAIFQASARITDLTENRIVDYRLLENNSEGELLGSVKFVKKFPVVVPQVTNAEVTPTENFVIQLRKGHTYRFELFAAAKATSGYVANPGATTFARIDFRENFADIGNYSPGVELVNFSIDVATDQSEELQLLKATVESLQQSLSTLSDQLVQQGEDFQEQLEYVNNSLASQREDIILLQETQNLVIDEQNQLADDINSIKGGLESIDARLTNIEEHLTKKKDPKSPQGRWLPSN